MDRSVAVYMVSEWTTPICTHTYMYDGNMTVYLLPADNVFAVKSWCKNKFGLEESVIDKQFSIPEDFDYIN